jgi:hypothetical protein
MRVFKMSDVHQNHAVWSTRSDPPVDRRKLLLAAAAGLAATTTAGIAIAAPINADLVFAAIEAHREAYTAMEKAEADYNASLEDEGPLADLLHEAGDHERALFHHLISTEPRSLAGFFALIAYVDEVAMRQDAKGAYDDGPEMLFANLREAAAIRGVA